MANGPSATAIPAFPAGTSFTLNTSVNPASAGNYDGVLTQNAGNIKSQDPTKTTKVFGGTVGSLNPTSLLAGQPSINASYSEVGYLYIEPDGFVDAAYTAVDSSVNDCVTGSSSNTLSTTGKYGCNVANQASQTLGRFRPNHFTTVVSPACTSGGFTYAGSANPSRIGQAFTVTVTARNSNGVATTNYRGLFAPAPVLSNGGSFSGLSGNSLTFLNGVANPSVIYTATTPQSAPLSLSMRASDSDPGGAVSSTGFTEGTSPIRSGQLRLSNAYGSELLDLPMTLTTQYWTGTGWSTNTQDSCTTGIALSGTIVSGPLTIAKVCVWDNGAPGASGLGCTTAVVSSKRFFTPPIAGNFNLTLQKPGVNFQGSVDITAAVPTWLQYVGGGNVATNPRGRATFGIYKSPLIFMRENY